MKQTGYGSKARIGLVTPQANPTAEPEIQALSPAGVSILTTRCTSQGQAQERFVEYFEKLDRSLSTFDSLKLNAVGFACTASSYLLDTGVEADRTRELEERFSTPVITASAAIHEALEYLGVQRIAIACPYPQWLFDLAVSYWKNQGYSVAASMSVQPEMEDTRAIYNVDANHATRQIITSFEGIEADAYLITGTGMPGLRSIIDLQERFGKPAMNSNLCLAWACLRAADIPPGDRSPTESFPLLSGWQYGLSRM